MLYIAPGFKEIMTSGFTDGSSCNEVPSDGVDSRLTCDGVVGLWTSIGTSLWETIMMRNGGFPWIALVGTLSICVDSVCKLAKGIYEQRKYPIEAAMSDSVTVGSTKHTLQLGEYCLRYLNYSPSEQQRSSFG